MRKCEQQRSFKQDTEVSSFRNYTISALEGGSAPLLSFRIAEQKTCWSIF